MNQLKHLFYIIIGFLLIAGCVPEPSFPDAPNIQFLSVTNIPFPERSLDSVYVSILIEDGDGDLGLSSNDIDPPYSPTIIDGSGNEVQNRFVNNFFITVKKKVNGNFEAVSFPGGTSFNGRFPILQENRGALEVKLNYGIGLFLGVLQSPVAKGDEVIFEVQIVDRALNESNTISTEPIILGE